MVGEAVPCAVAAAAVIGAAEGASGVGAEASARPVGDPLGAAAVAEVDSHLEAVVDSEKFMHQWADTGFVKPSMILAG